MNIIIRRMKSSDADALYRLLSDPEVMRYLEPLYDRAQTEAFLHRAGLSEPPLVYAAEGNGRFIGYVIYHPYLRLTRAHTVFAGINTARHCASR